MKSLKHLTRIAACAVCALVTAEPARAAGLLIADGGFGGQLEIVEHEVNVTVNNGIAVTHVTQVFRNKEDRQVEALYTFPVPRGASVANFSMWIQGREMIGEVLEKERAREIYNSYKAVRQDPGLLEQVDYRTFEMRIFPIEPRADQRVQITYYQELDIDDDTFTYVYPLATTTRAHADSQVTERLAFNIDIRSAVPLVEVDSPSHGADLVVVQHVTDYYQASLETPGGRVDRDMVIVGKVSRAHTGIDVVTSNPAGEDGYFMLTLTAGDDLGSLNTGMDYVFVLDISGSMANQGKLLASKQSLSAFVAGLQPEDALEVMTFNLQPNPLFGALQPAAPDAIARATAFLDGQRAAGGTVLSPAMTTAYRYHRADRPLNVVVLSDGITEQRERRELARLINERPEGTRVFCIGVGNDVNRPLLEQIAAESGGLAAFISAGDDFERQAKAFRRKLLRPVAAQVSIDIKGVDAYDIEPQRLPDLFHGSPIRVYGRYRGAGAAQINVSADVRGAAFRQRAEINFPARDDANPEIERMWAWRRVDGLLKTDDSNGARRSDTINEIVRLGEAYSIVTEYTSFLVLENEAEYRRWKIERRNERRLGRDRTAQERRQQELEALRQRAASQIGPQPLEQPLQLASAKPPTTRGPSTPQAPSQPQPGTRNENRQSWDFNTGTGPVGPLFLLTAGWLIRRRRHTGAADSKNRNIASNA